jgi:hypothetical protein
LFFFDEARFGTHSKLGHGWFEIGKRTSVSLKSYLFNSDIYNCLGYSGKKSSVLRITPR